MGRTTSHEKLAPIEERDYWPLLRNVTIGKTLVAAFKNDNLFSPVSFLPYHAMYNNNNP